MDEYDHTTALATRFRDLDTNGHVNNAVYVSYLEQARAEYFADVLETSLVDAEVVIARLELEYEAPIELGERVTVATRVSDLGGSSVGMDHVVETDGRSAATAETTIVAFDRDAGTARAVPDAWREAIRAHEPGLG